MVLSTLPQLPGHLLGLYWWIFALRSRGCLFVALYLLSMSISDFTRAPHPAGGRIEVAPCG
jgi:hypothetical protein